MKRKLLFRRPLIAGIILASGTVWLLWMAAPHYSSALAAEPAPKGAKDEVTALRAEVNRLKGIVGDQSHAMSDVGYHFANLWFAGKAKNWPLAKFYFDETRSHINWAIRVIPVRKDSAGRDVELKPIWEAIDASVFSQIGKAIQQQNGEQFKAAYRGAMAGCYACHKASSKPYLRPQVPTTPPQPIINFNPEADWPE